MTKSFGTKSTNASTLHLLHRAGQCATDIFHREMLDADITPRQLAVLAAVAENPAGSQTRLVEVTVIDRSTLADLMRRMIKKDLVKRKRSKADARAYTVDLTEVGARVLARARPVGDRVDFRLLEAVPANHRERFISDLQRIVQVLNASGE